MPRWQEYYTSVNTECRVSMYSFLCRNLYFALLILSYIFLRDCTLKYLEFRRRRIHEICISLPFFCVLSQILTYISRNSVLQNTWVLKKNIKTTLLSPFSSRELHVGIEHQNDLVQNNDLFRSCRTGNGLQAPDAENLRHIQTRQTR